MYILIYTIHYIGIRPVLLPCHTADGATHRQRRSLLPVPSGEHTQVGAHMYVCMYVYKYTSLLPVPSGEHTQVLNPTRVC
jgi:hypothetical protein